MRISAFRLMAFIIAASGALYSAFGQGMLDNGAIGSGTLTGNTSQVWTFYATAGDHYICAGINSVGAPNPNFVPSVNLRNPDGTDLFGTYDGDVAYNICTRHLTQTGYYQAVVKNFSYVAPTNYTASYTINVAVPSQPYAATNGGGFMTPGQAYTGQLDLADFQIWTYPANSGDRVSVTMTNTSGNSDIIPWITISNPDGTVIGGTYNSPVVYGYNATQTGNYTVLAYQYQPLYTGSYTIEVTGSTAASTAAKAQGSPGCKLPGQCFVGAPINVASGNMFEQARDYTTSGANPLAFTRSYNSFAQQNNLFATTLGPNWRSNYDRFLRVNSSSVVQSERPDGQVINFKLVSGVWTPDTDVDYSLGNSGTSWTLTDPDDSTETYAGSSGQLSVKSIKSRNGYTQTLNYSGALLNSVSDSYGRSLSLTYAGGMLSTVTTPESLVLTYGYTAAASSSLLTSVSYNTDPVSSQSYLYENASLPFALTGITDESGQRYATWAYDGVGRALSSTHAGNAGYTQISYDDTTGNRTVTGPFGIQDTYKFTTLQSIPKVAEIDRAAFGSVAAATRSFTYDANGYLASSTDWEGNSTSYTNDAHGLPTTIVEASGSSVARTTTITYDQTWSRLPASITTPGLTAGFTYDDTTGDLLTRTLTDTSAQAGNYAAAMRKWTYTWANFLLASVSDPRGDATRLDYDASGALTSTTNALGQATRITSHTAGGRPQTIVDPNGVTTKLTYDGRQRLTSSIVQTAAGTLKTTFAYDLAGNLTSTTQPDGSTRTDAYDAAHRLTAVTDALGNKAADTLDAFGNVTQVKVTDAGGAARRTAADNYDAVGRLLQNTGGAGQVTSYAYDRDGNLTGSTDPLGRVTTRQYDALNRPVSLTDPAKGVTSQTYDAHDRPLSVTTPNGARTAYTYDGFGDLVQIASPDTGATVYHYDAAGNLAQKADAAGAVTNHTYDALNRVLTTTYPGDPAENVAFSYDQPGHGFGIGRLTGMTDQLGSLSRSYDERGNLLTDTRQARGRAAGAAYAYDAASRITSMTYPSGTTVTYSRDAAGQVAGVATQAGVVASGVTHLPFGPVNGFTFGNGIADTRTFDLDYRMTGLVDQVSSSPATQSLAYSYDLANNVKTITDGVRPYLTQAFGYDVLDRLTSAAATDYGSFAWTYDPNGNRLSESRGPASVPTIYGYTPASNRLASLSLGGVTTQIYSYTPTGHLTGAAIASGAQVAALSYNQADRVQASTGYGQILAEYGYDGFGKRLAKLVSGTTPTGTLFQYGQDGSLLEEADIAGNAKADYIYLDGMPIGDIAPATETFSYLHTDHLGTPQLATDNSKGLVWGAAYYPFGGTSYLAGTITQNLRLPGQYFDVETQSYHNGFRDYAPTFGRYVESDPVGLYGGPNTYAYVGGNPLSHIDPTGLIDLSKPGQLLACLFVVCNPQMISTPTDPANPTPQVIEAPHPGFKFGQGTDAPAPTEAPAPNSCPVNRVDTPKPPAALPQFPIIDFFEGLPEFLIDPLLLLPGMQEQIEQLINPGQMVA